MFRIRVERGEHGGGMGGTQDSAIGFLFRRDVAMRKKSADTVPMIREYDAERLLYVRRIIDEWIARLAIPKPGRRKLITKRAVIIRHQLSDHKPQERDIRRILALGSSLAAGLALAVASRAGKK
jgi:hypothetical protein